MWIVPWDPVLKLFLLKKVLAGPVNCARDPHKKRRCASAFLFSAIQTCTKFDFPSLIKLHSLSTYNLFTFISNELQTNKKSHPNLKTKKIYFKKDMRGSDVTFRWVGCVCGFGRMCRWIELWEVIFYLLLLWLFLHCLKHLNIFLGALSKCN